MKNRPRFVLLSLVLFLVSACSASVPDEAHIASILVNRDSEYEKTFKELHLGSLFDFDLTLSQADESWVTLWAEGYRNGQPAGEGPFQTLSFGNFPEPLHEGRLGFGLINIQSEDPMLLIYSSGATLSPSGLKDGFFKRSGASTWDYAVSDGGKSLAWGEELILAVFRQDEGEIRGGYDYKDKAQVEQMIQDDETVLLMKMKVDRKTR